MGDWLGGWDDYDWRWKMKEFPTQLPATKKPRWTGERVKHLVWMQEQGLGDQIQMLRYAPMLRERVDKLSLFCSPELFDLIPYVKGIDAVLADFPKDEEDWDAYSPMFDACKILGVEPSNCSGNPYISIDGVASEVKPYPGKTNVGLAKPAFVEELR